MRDSDSEAVAGTLRATRIMLGAMGLGPLLFLGVVLYLRRPGSVFETTNATGLLLTYASLGLGVCMLAASVLVPTLVAAQGRARLDAGAGPDRWLAIFRSARIVGAALLEGAALLACVAYLLEGWWPALVVAGLFPVLIFLFLLPTAHGLDEWLEEQRRRLRSDRV